ncbi:molybdenum cofactor biosynthesis protein B [Thalassolituus marinus]|uniref:Molybdenum cofactor biosynthesis protein B n=1 Tax=Thalassolituus marinus TaxID=671053 RepID=A0ABS7ZTM7_9GAMM|nr:molybdenum cofactor biosynthesis protein B [Thalassolituus marinus]MCA6063751.1 molybdenum cofactor biosynthesis protein B [Thalassolituus marinus]
MRKHANREFFPLNIALLTLSDSRSAEQDSSGDLLQQLAGDAGHRVLQRSLLPHDRYQIRAQVSQWIASSDVQVIIINGGTGFAAGNCTPEAIRPLFDSEVEGFGEQFRQLSFADIGSSSMQSRALAGMANGTLLFAVPGSGGACRQAWEALIAPQLDGRTGPCNFVAHVKNSPQPACR